MLMKSKLPNIPNKSRICIICEGYEEYEYMDKLVSLDVWNNQYDIKLVNAEGIPKIPARYQEKYQVGSHDLVLVFCDTDLKPHEQYEEIKSKINAFHGSDEAADEVVIYGNPCTMQIIIEHWGDIKLESNKKYRNASIIKELVGIKKYRARKEQRNQMFSHITVDNYKEMSLRIKRLPSDDTIVNSSNFGKFLDRFSSEDNSWIKDINDKLEE